MLVNDSIKDYISDKIELILFVSIDLIGSTAYKNKYPNSNDFSLLFLNFYRSMPQYLYSAIINISSKYPDIEFDPYNHLVRLIKVLGDEVILKIDLNKFIDVPIILVGLRDAINAYRNKYLIDKGLDLKATVWTASFPIINKEIKVPIVPTPAGKRVQELTDYLGPSMDLGFRLTKYSNENLITISLEVACIFSLIPELTHKIFQDEKIEIIYDKLESLKGIYGGQPYPIFWIENLTYLEEARKDIKGNILNPNLSITPGEISYNKLYHYCKLYIDKIGNNNLLCEPYITENVKNDIKVIDGIMPPEHRDQLKEYYNIISLSSFKIP